MKTELIRLSFCAVVAAMVLLLLAIFNVGTTTMFIFFILIGKASFALGVPYPLASVVGLFLPLVATTAIVRIILAAAAELINRDAPTQTA